ncbi:MAG: hypothetical protein Q7J16_03135 [Candidatus Cloacimonadales bacterium]|nr:hypothetical protein [Candidatus Cloacimonadales bacterium]
MRCRRKTIETFRTVLSFGTVGVKSIGFWGAGMKFKGIYPAIASFNVAYT